MKWMLTAKEVVKSFYEKYDRYLNALMRFVFALSVYTAVVFSTGYNATVSSPFVVLLLALISAFLPRAAIAFFTALILTMEFLSVHLIVAAVAVVMLLVMLLVYFVFKTGDSWVLSFTLMMCLLRFSPAILPIGLLISPAEIPAAVFGVILYGLIIVVRKDFGALSSRGGLNLGGRVNLLLTDLVTSSRFVLILVTLTLTLIFISTVRRSRLNYAAAAASVSGGLLYLIAFLLGNYFLNTEVQFVSMIAAFLLDALISWFLIQFVIGADYRRTENVRFEDDDYYYFVKAIPKTSVSITDKREENITEDNEEDTLVPQETVEFSIKGVFVQHEDEAGEEREEEKR